MELQKVNIVELQPHPANYNTHPETQIQELVKSLDMFDQFKNIVVCQGRIIAGHGLVEAAKRKGMTEIYALIRDDLTEEQQKALLVADNAMPFLALPDPSALEELLSSLSVDIPGVTNEWLTSLNINLDLEIDDVHTEVADPENKETKTEQCPKCGFVWQK
jgi:ParB-like chromosome segregation protein Spo0J